MKRFLIITFVIVAQMSFGQVTKNLVDFSDIKVFDKLKVELISSSENKAEITGNRESEVEFVNKNGELKIRMPFPKLLSGDDITIKLYFRNIESITATEGSFVSCDTRFKQTIMDLSAKEGAQINIDLDVEKVNVKAVTGGIIELSGKALNQDVVIMSGGNLQSKELHTSQTSINVSAGGNAEIHASLLLTLKLKQEARFTFMEVQDKSIKKHYLVERS